jgi:hypothetical protein
LTVMVRVVIGGAARSGNASARQRIIRRIVS